MMTTATPIPSASAPGRARAMDTTGGPDVDAPRALLSGPKVVLHLEGLAILAAASIAYFALGHGWILFVSLFLLPDLSMLGYLRGPRVGAVGYDAAHSYLAPLALLGVGWLAAAPTAMAVALIWIAHVGFDRALGYGLKYGTAFRDTHLGRV